MPPYLHYLESILRYLGMVTGLGTLVFIIIKAVIAQSRPAGLQTGKARQVLRTSYFLLASAFFLILAYFLFTPLPIQLSWPWSLVSTLLGALILQAGVGLYLWGFHSLGQSFNVSSGFGVRLQAAHQLVTTGPYAWVRHPMYLAVIHACWGGLLLYRTWTMLLFAVMMIGLVYRARKEDEALSQAFGADWESYRARVPAWLPRIKR